MRAVADTSVLIAFKRLGYLGNLPGVFDEVLLPRAVVEEAREEELHEDLKQLVSQGFASIAEATNQELARAELREDGFWAMDLDDIGDKQLLSL